MDTMTYKHKNIFGPIASEIFAIENKEKFQRNWENINLYSKSRGINRFEGLYETLKSVNYPYLEGIKEWINKTSELSNQSLEREIKKYKSRELVKTLEWSKKVNKKISENENKFQAFDNVRESLLNMSKNGSVYVVSSANKEAVEKEWEKNHLIEYVEKIFCQDTGKKKEIIQSLIKEKDEKSLFIMIGDAPGDLRAAKKNNILFYPILAGKEVVSWKEFNKNIINKIVNRSYKNIEKEYIEKFWNNLD